jgi:hypothetical protein
MTATRRAVVLGLLVLAAGGSGAAEQTPRERVRRHLPCPLLFAYDLTGPDAPAVARNLGLTAVYVPLKSVSAERVAEARETLSAADMAQVPAIVGLPCHAGELHFSPTDDKYAEAVTSSLRAAIRVLKDEPAVAAWATMDFPDQSLGESDRAFRQYLERWYKDVGLLNRAWGAKAHSFTEVTTDLVARLDAERPYAIGRASFDLCEYRRQLFLDLHRLWAAAIRSEDPERPLLTGRLPEYRSLLCIPDGYDVIVPAVAPELGESEKHPTTLQAVDMARRANRFLAVPAVSTPPLERAGEQSLPRWAMLAGLHGAWGIAFAESGVLRSNRGLTRQLRQLCQQARLDPAFGKAPACTAAVLLEPYDAGVEGTLPGPYGFLTGLPPREPASLCEDLARGSRFGPVDYLAVEDVREVDLNRYGSLLAPCAAAAPTFVQQAVTAFVREGGCFVADLGLGAHDTGDWSLLPPPLAELAGLAQVVELKRWQGDLVFASHPLFPSVPPGRVLAPVLPNGGQGSYFSGWTLLAQLAPGAQTLAVLTSAYEDKPTGPPGPDGKPTRRPRYGGLIAHRVGAGLCVLATHPLWGKWRRGCGNWEEFHHDLLARRARYGLLDQPGLFPEGLDVSSDGEWAFVYNDTPDERLVRLHLPGAAHRASLGGFAHFSTEFQDAAGQPKGDAIVTLVARRAETATAQFIPVEIHPRSGEAAAQVTVYGEGMVRLTVGGEGTTVERRAGGYRLIRDRPNALRLQLASGLYPIAPGSPHRLTIQEQGGAPQEVLVTADQNGRLEYEGRFRLAEVTVQPQR